MAVFDDAWSTINERYYDRNFSSLAEGLSWNSQRANFRSLAAETTSGLELYAVLRRMLASLNDPHTRVFMPGEKSDWWRPRLVTIGLAIREIEGIPTVVRVEPGSPPERAGLVAGDIIETINNEPAQLLLQRKLSKAMATSGHMRARAVATLIDGPPQTSVEISWRRKDGRKVSSEFRRYLHERELGLRIRRNDGIAIIEMDGFTREISRKLVAALKEVSRDARGVVLDLRANGGGDAEAMIDVASSFLGAGFNLGRFIDRSARQIPLVTREKSPLIPNRLTKVNLPLVVLTSERTSSAAEIFVAELRASKRATVVGTETCGCVLAIRTRHQLPDGGILDISELDYQTASGERLEKNGVEPDTVVSNTREDLYANRDRAIELAIRKLKMQREVKQTVSLLGLPNVETKLFNESSPPRNAN
jgi:carboxyl-terminal processing protease